MRLLLVSEFFYPYKTSTPKILTELAEDLVSYGVDVEVLTTKNSYGEEKKKSKRYEIYNGIKIKRIFSTAFKKESKLGRITNYLFFLGSVFKNLILKKDYDKILFVSNPPIVPYMGYIMKKWRGKEYVYLVHDIYPDVAEHLGVIKEGSLISRVMNRINNKIYMNASKVIVLGHDMKRVIEGKGVNPDNIEIVTNWADSHNTFETEVPVSYLEEHQMNKKFNVVYTGNISKVHSVGTILDVVKELKDDMDIMFTFVGNGSMKEHIKQMKEEFSLKNLQVLDYMFGDDYNNMLNSASVFISTLQKGVEGLGVPSKTYTYMSVSKPIIAIMDKTSEIGSLVIEKNLGGQFDANDITGIKDIITKLKNDNTLYNQVSENVKNIFENNYERKKVTKLFYENLV